MQKLCCWNCSAERRRAHWTALGGEGKYRGLDLILTTKLITDTSHPYWENSHQYWENMFCRQHRNVPGKYKNENGEKSNLKNAILGTAKLEAANFQTGGGAKSAVAFNWIDLERVWHCKSYSWHTAEFKNVCKYGVAIHIEGSRSLWRKKYPSGGLRSPNPLPVASGLGNLTILFPTFEL